MTVVCMFRDGRGNRRGRGAEVFTLCLCTGTPPTAIYTLSLHDALPISQRVLQAPVLRVRGGRRGLRETGHRLHGRRHHRLLDRLAPPRFQVSAGGRVVHEAPELVREQAQDPLGQLRALLRDDERRAHGMKCPRCQQENPPQAKFCPECATPLAPGCVNCGHQLPPAAKFCPECAHPVDGSAAATQRFGSPDSYTPKHLAERILTSKAALQGERKQVTVLFADVKGSMELLADRDPEEARKILDPLLERMMEAVHRYEGTVNQVMGDGIMALFGAPVAHEDHAVRACYAALRMQESIKRYAEEARRAHGINVQIRIGLNSGEVVVRAIGNDLHMDYTAVGQTTHLAARMEQFASPGSTLLTPSTLELVKGYVAVKPLGPVRVKGLTESVEIYEVTGAGPAPTRLQAASRRGLTRFVGRDAEQDHLYRAQQLAGRGH